jgi:hypothetical protein
LNRVLVYVEGPSDRAAMEALLAPLLGELRQRGVRVNFFTEESGDRKKALLLKVPEKAVNILRSQPRALVAVMPDLYPKNRGFPHETFAELDRGIRENFRSAMQRKRVNNPDDLELRFKVFCFKHDLEALVLASYESLKTHLGAPALPRTWSPPVENVNHDRPPKRVVEDLFVSCGQRYRDTVDAPLILSTSSYRAVAEDCPQGFKPFVELLASL